jgi:hypothetical protein
MQKRPNERQHLYQVNNNTFSLNARLLEIFFYNEIVVKIILLTVSGILIFWVNLVIK